MTEKSIISVIVPTFNRKEMLRQCLYSIIAQTYTNFEIIIVDNMSADGTEEYVKTLTDKRIKYFRNQNNGVIAVNRNFGLRKATGEFLSFCDDDDLWLPNKLTKQIAIFELNKNIKLVSSNAIIFKNNKISKLLSKQNNDQIPNIKSLINGNKICNSTVLFKKACIDNVGYLSESIDICGVEDYDFWLRIAKNSVNSIYVMSEPLILYRIHSKNFSEFNVDKDINKLKIVMEQHTDVESIESININLNRMRNSLSLWYKLDELDFKKTGIINFIFSETSLLIKIKILFYYFRRTISKILGIYSFSIKNKLSIQKFLNSTLNQGKN